MKEFLLKFTHFEHILFRLHVTVRKLGRCRMRFIKTELEFVLLAFLLKKKVVTFFMYILCPFAYDMTNLLFQPMKLAKLSKVVIVFCLLELNFLKPHRSINIW